MITESKINILEDVIKKLGIKDETNKVTLNHAEYLIARKLNLTNLKKLRDLLHVIIHHRQNVHLQSSDKLCELFNKVLSFVKQDILDYVTEDDVIDDLYKLLSNNVKKENYKYDVNNEMIEIKYYFGENLLFNNLKDY